MNYEAQTHIRNDVLKKTGIDVFKLMEQNYKLLAVAGCPDDTGTRFTFIITTLTSILSSTLKVLCELGLNKKGVQDILDIINRSALDAVAEVEAKAEEKRTQQL